MTDAIELSEHDNQFDLVFRNRMYQLLIKLVLDSLKSQIFFIHQFGCRWLGTNCHLQLNPFKMNVNVNLCSAVT